MNKINPSDRQIGHARARSVPGAAAVAAVAAALIVAVGLALSASAQTLTAPNSRAGWSPPAAAKSRPAARLKSCSTYGAGFVNIPGTDACVKIGGYVTIEGTARQDR
jgi:Porin subfamily